MASIFTLKNKFFLRKEIFFALIFLFPFFLRAQGSWVWMHGSNTPNPVGNFGTQSVAAATNNPPGMYEPYEWTDQQGKFWIMGGYNSSLFQIFSDLWKFDPATNMWTWMRGPGMVNAAGIYGTQGVASPANQPGGRFRGFSWVDNSGNLWLFGGYGYDVNGNVGRLSDLWMFDISTNQWTWMKGPNTVNTPGSYGSLQAPSPSNNPDPRDECAAAWTSNSGELWLFGGQTATGFLSDVWRYSPATNMWTWMSGPNTINNLPSYGTIYQQASSNTPGGRCNYARWKDASGNFWMFGGVYSGNVLNDVWKYNPAVNQWTYMGGTTLWNDLGNYGNNCEVNNYCPSGRTETRCTWKDPCDRMWFMGGNNSGFLNAGVSDLWFFDPALNQFVIAGGNAALNQAGNFGTMLVSSASNYPPSNCGSLGFTDNSGNFWLFGGLLNPAGDNTNAIWKYTRPVSCPSYIFSIVPSAPNGCSPLPISFTLNPASTSFIYHWDFGDNSTLADTSSLANPSYTYTTTGTFTVTLIVHNTLPCNLFTDTVTTSITVNSIPVPNLGNDTTICGPMNLNLSAGIIGNNYLWNTGDTLQNITVSSAGTYSVTVTQNNCPGSDSIVVTNLLQPDLGADTSFCQGQTLNLNIGLWDNFLWSTGSSAPTISVNTSGIYFVTVNTSPCNFSDTINVVVNPIPQVNLGNDTMLCPGVSYSLDAGNPGASFAWNTGANSEIISPSTAGYYNVIVTENNCIGSGDINLSYFPNLDLGPSIQLCNVLSVDISAGPPGYNYLWSTGDTSNTITVFNAGIYSVQVNNGVCVLNDSVEVTGSPGSGLLFVPNAFTPNYNGLNDNFRAYGDGIIYFHMMIFDRWGELMFETNDINQGWDGDPHGKKTMSNVFVYKIDYRTDCSGDQDIEKIGHVSVIR